MRARGIDISYYDISFDPNKAIQPIDFVIQRVSYGALNGMTYSDPAFKILLPNVKKVGICGGYHYLSTQSGWKAQADFFLTMIRDCEYDFYALDFESAFNQITSKFSKDANSWMEYIFQKTGKKVLFYTNPSLYDSYGWAYCSRWPLWLAQYWKYPSPTKNPRMPRKRSSDNWTIYQYASEINYPGHAKEYGCGANSVDINVFNGTVEDMQKWLDEPTIELPVTRNREGNINTIFGLNVRDQPNLFGKKLYALPYKAHVTIYDEKNGWYKISSSLEQWMYSKYITLK